MSGSAEAGHWLTLETLPIDILYLILNYCDVKCVLALSLCSKRFHQLLHNDDYVWLRWGVGSLATNQVSEQMKSRSSRLLSSLDKCKVSANWRNAVFRHKCLIRHKSKYLPWICLEKQFLWLTKGNEILKYKRNPKNGSINRHSLVDKFVASNQDICRFVLRNQFVVSGGRNGLIAVWNKFSARKVFSDHRLHANDINSIDFCDPYLLISGSKDKTFKLWSLDVDDSVLELKNTVVVDDRVWNVSANRRNDSLIVGTAGCGPLKPLLMYDIETCQLLTEFGLYYQRGAGVLHSIWESDQQVLSCGYDTSVRLWDIRSPEQCVLDFEDPHNSVVYCMASDHFVTILSGTSRYGLTRLWDKRCAKSCVQMYYVGSDNSPVYSLSFDGLSAYIALDSSINLLSFN